MNVKEIHNLLQTRKTAFFDKLRYKTVAIVGRAHYLSTIKQRALIESHDVIVRVHGPFIHNFKSIDQTPYIGKRTDIYVSRLWWQGKEMIEQMVKEQRQHNFIMVAENFYEMQSSITNWRLLEKERCTDTCCANGVLYEPLNESRFRTPVTWHHHDSLHPSEPSIANLRDRLCLLSRRSAR